VKWMGRPFGYLLCGSLGALALYGGLIPAVDLREVDVAFVGSLGAVLGYGVERFITTPSSREPRSLRGEHGLNRQAALFLAAWKVFIAFACGATLLVIAHCAGVGQLPRH